MSAFAHGSDVNNHFFVRKGEDVPTLKLAPGGDEIKPVIDSSIICMHIMLDAANSSFGLGEEAVVGRIASELPKPKAGQ